jgi:serine/threonine protein kinase
VASDDDRPEAGAPPNRVDGHSSATDSAAAGMQFPGQLDSGLVLADRYRLERELGRGAMGVVYVARDLQLLGADSTRVVIKVLNDDALRDSYTRRKFFQEFESLTRVNHPNVVKVLGRGALSNGTPFFAMEFVDGESLRATIPPEGMEFDRAAAIVRQIGNALTAVHERGILHCDLKPANIMLQEIDGEDVVKLIDFGVAKIKDSLIVQAAATRMLGTLNYASPEHFTGGLSRMSDVYCFGLIAYEIVTGRRPFNPTNEAHMCFLQNEGVRVRPRDLRPGLSSDAQDTIMRALSKHPQERYSCARDLGEALAKALAADSPMWAPFASSIPGCEIDTAGTRTPVLQVAYVLFIELVGYAALPIDRQVDAMRQLEQIVHGSHAVGSAGFDKSVVLLPCGEGFGLVYLTDPTAPLQSASEIAAELRKHATITYRMGIHSAPVYLNTERDTRKSVAGPCVAVAKLITQYGDAGHILLSGSVAEYVTQVSFWAQHLVDLGEQLITEGVKLRLYSFSKGDLGNAQRPCRCVPASGLHRSGVGSKLVPVPCQPQAR